jgi:cytochrome P450
MLIRAENEDNGSLMSDLQLRDEVMTLFMAGHETTANTLAWAWYSLSQHPKAEAKVAL